MKLVTDHMQERLSDPGRYDRTGKRIMADLLGDYGPDEYGEVVDEVVTTGVRARHNLIMASLAMISMAAGVSECEFYFRRFPFANLPLTRADHLRNCVEMYFDRVAQFRDRLKHVLNLTKGFDPEFDANIGSIAKAYTKTFDFELRSRNHVHHHGRFEDRKLSQLSMVQLLTPGMPILASVVPERSLYRVASREWVRKVRNSRDTINQYIEIASKLISVAIQEEGVRSASGCNA